jgi:hypothetical protein
MSLEGDSHEVEVTPNLKLLVTLVRAWREFVIISLILIRYEKREAAWLSW